MTLVASGLISLGGSTSGRSVNLELKKAAAANCTLNDTAVRALAKKTGGIIKMSDLYGKSSSLAAGVTPGWIDMCGYGVWAWSIDQYDPQGSIVPANPTYKGDRLFSITSDAIDVFGVAVTGGHPASWLKSVTCNGVTLGYATAVKAGGSSGATGGANWTWHKSSNPSMSRANFLFGAAGATIIFNE